MTHVTLEWTAASETGRQQQWNEDAYAVIPEARLFVLADGMSKQPAGHLASRMAVETVRAYYSYQQEVLFGEALRRLSLPRAATQLYTAYCLANKLVHERNVRVNPLRPMGTTLLGVQFLHRHVVIAHVGDSRCYRVCYGELTQLTRDHILLEENRRYLTAREIDDLRPLQQVLSRAVGRDRDIEVGICAAVVRPNDLYLLCSNGLFETLPPEAIVEILAATDSLDDACRSLVATAHAIDGRDDITAILARLQPAPKHLRWTASSQDETSEKSQSKE